MSIVEEYLKFAAPYTELANMKYVVLKEEPQKGSSWKGAKVLGSYMSKPGRNSQCTCGCGKKAKKCSTTKHD